MWCLPWFMDLPGPDADCRRGGALFLTERRVLWCAVSATCGTSAEARLHICAELSHTYVDSGILHTPSLIVDRRSPVLPTLGTHRWNLRPSSKVLCCSMLRLFSSVMAHQRLNATQFVARLAHSLKAFRELQPCDLPLLSRQMDDPAPSTA